MRELKYRVRVKWVALLEVADTIPLPSSRDAIHSEGVVCIKSQDLQDPMVQRSLLRYYADDATTGLL
jgi:hypothetical protein